MLVCRSCLTTRKGKLFHMHFYRPMATYRRPLMDCNDGDGYVECGIEDMAALFNVVGGLDVLWMAQIHV